MLLAANSLMLVFAVAFAVEGWRRNRYRGLSPTRHWLGAALLFAASAGLAAYFWNEPRYWQFDVRHPLPCGDYGCP